MGRGTGWAVRTALGALGYQLADAGPPAGLEDIGADAELDIVQPGIALSEFYRFSIAAMAGPLISSEVMTATEEARLDDPDFLGCGFALIGAWGRRPAEALG